MNLPEISTSAIDAAFWRTLVPFLRIDVDTSVASAIHPAVMSEADRLRASGWARLERAIPTSVTKPLADALRCLHDANVPAPFLFVFDEPWALATMLAPTWTALLGATPRVVPDVWASYLVEGRGWDLHRGVDDSSTSLVNAWVALSDVGAESACMSVVPFGSTEPIALPVPAGSMLAWSAYVSRSSGGMKPGAPPHASLSFTLDAASGPERMPSFEERVALVAKVLVAYEKMAGGASGPWLEWAYAWQRFRP